ncbi:MAG: hypothetical protein AB1798_05120 [Spirochaetota bacterium]
MNKVVFESDRVLKTINRLPKAERDSIVFKTVEILSKLSFKTMNIRKLRNRKGEYRFRIVVKINIHIFPGKVKNRIQPSTTG